MVSPNPLSLSPDNADEYESTSLAMGILSGDTDRVRMLVNIGVTLSTTHHWVLYQACVEDVEMLQAVVAGRGVTLDAVVPGAHGDCLLHYILRTPSTRFSSDKTSVVKVLLENGAEPFAHDRHGDTSLHILAGMNSEDHALFSLFLQPSIHTYINRRNRYGDTALIIAVIYDHYDAARALLEFGADPNARGEGGKTAMDFALQYGNSGMAGLLSVFGGSLDGIGQMLVDPFSSCLDTEMDLANGDDAWCDVEAYLRMQEDEESEIL